MNRRSFLQRLSIFAAAYILMSFRYVKYAMGGPLEVWSNHGGFYVKTIMERSGNAMTRLEISVETFLPEGQLYATSVLERLRAAGVVEPNDPLAGFVAVQAMSPRGTSDAFIRIISIKTPIKTIRVSGPLVFTVDGVRVDNSQASSGRYMIQPRGFVNILLNPGQSGEIVS